MRHGTYLLPLRLYPLPTRLGGGRTEPAGKCKVPVSSGATDKPAVGIVRARPERPRSGVVSAAAAVSITSPCSSTYTFRSEERVLMKD